MPPSGRVAQGVNDALDVVGVAEGQLIPVDSSKGTNKVEVITDELMHSVA